LTFKTTFHLIGTRKPVAAIQLSKHRCE